MGWFDRWRKRAQKINRGISGVGSVFLIPLMLLTTADVVSRDLFNHPIPGAVELSEYILSIFILLGLAYAQQAKSHVGVSLFTSKLSTNTQSILLILTALICLFICVILTWQGLVVGLEERTVSDWLRVPQYPFRLLVAVAGFLTCFELLIDLGSAVQKLEGRS